MDALKVLWEFFLTPLIRISIYASFKKKHFQALLNIFYYNKLSKTIYLQRLKGKVKT